MDEFKTANQTVKNNKLFTQKSMNIYKSDKTLLYNDDIRYIHKQMIDKYVKSGGKIIIRALGADKWITITAENRLNLEDEEEYLKGRVKEETKFTSFSQIEVTLINRKYKN